MTIAQKLVDAWQEKKYTLGGLAKFCRDSGLVVEANISDELESDFYTFTDSSVLEIDWQKSKAYC